jgi:inward rectifier potassium channel
LFMNTQPKAKNQDLGLGYKVTQEQEKRFINRDGTFNVRREGIAGRSAFSLYHAILAIPWPAFYAWLLVMFLMANAVFAAGYLISGPEAFPQLAHLPIGQRYWGLFLYSIQVLTTLGASPLHPETTAPNILLGAESTIGLLGFALATGLIIARFSNPRIKILFSDNAVIAPYNDITGFMFRIINGRSNELIEVTAVVTLAVVDEKGKRQFSQLPLERDKVFVFPLNWTIVHPINESSPLWGLKAEDLARSQSEFLITITAVDRYLSKTIYARSSYLHNDIAIGARFVTMIRQDPDGRVVADVDLLSRIEKI